MTLLNQLLIIKWLHSNRELVYCQMVQSYIIGTMLEYTFSLILIAVVNMLYVKLYKKSDQPKYYIDSPGIIFLITLVYCIHCKTFIISEIIRK